MCLLLPLLTIATPDSPASAPALSPTPDGSGVVVPAGRYTVCGRTVKVAHTVALPVSPAPVVTVADEPLHLSAEPPMGFMQGTRLAGPDALDVNALNAYTLGSLTIKRQVGGTALQEGTDYMLSPEYAMVGCAPGGAITPADTVYASYQYGMMRLDAVEVNKNGAVVLREGTPHITNPLPPPPTRGWTRLAHIYRPYRATLVSAEEIYPVCETAAQATTGTTPGRIPRTLAKIRAGQPVTIVCFGDSVTAGGNASRPETRYVDVFTAELKKRFPKADITVVNVSVGGSTSRQWLDPEGNPPYPSQQNIDFSRVTNAHPDLVTVEFVNDAGMNAEQVESGYTELLQHFTDLGAECILITPHFTHPQWMGIDMRGVESREYVKALRAFADRHGVALADASARWEHLWKEGIPYLTLLHNSLNHPDDRGHRFFADELIKCFAE